MLKLCSFSLVFKKAPTTLDEKIEKVRKKRKTEVKPCGIYFQWDYNSVSEIYKVMTVCVQEKNLKDKKKTQAVASEEKEEEEEEDDDEENNENDEDEDRDDDVEEDEFSSGDEEVLKKAGMCLHHTCRM